MRALGHTNMLAGLGLCSAFGSTSFCLFVVFARLSETTFYYAEQTGLECRGPPASASQKLGFRGYSTLTLEFWSFKAFSFLSKYNLRCVPSGFTVSILTGCEHDGFRHGVFPPAFAPSSYRALGSSVMTYLRYCHC